jgi:hypothetical protein
MSQYLESASTHRAILAALPPAELAYAVPKVQRCLNENRLRGRHEYRPDICWISKVLRGMPPSRRIAPDRRAEPAIERVARLHQAG